MSNYKEDSYYVKDAALNYGPQAVRYYEDVVAPFIDKVNKAGVKTYISRARLSSALAELISNLSELMEAGEFKREYLEKEAKAIVDCGVADKDLLYIIESIEEAENPKDTMIRILLRSNVVRTYDDDNFRFIDDIEEALDLNAMNKEQVNSLLFEIAKYYYRKSILNGNEEKLDDFYTYLLNKNICSDSVLKRIKTILRIS